jgi:divinyl protochlorophyllide a 8-vinyl-reductase
VDTRAFLPEPGQGGRIGPNAVLQLIPVLQRAAGPILTARLMAEAGLQGPPSDHGLMAEAPAHALHRAVRAALPDKAPSILSEAGTRTADYILAHRIPKPAQAVLRWMPDVLATPALSKAIAKNAWAFAGSGRFTLQGRGAIRAGRQPAGRGRGRRPPGLPLARRRLRTPLPRSGQG